MLHVLALLLAITPTGNPKPITYTQDSTQSARNSIFDKLSDTISVRDAPWKATADGTTNDAASINLAMIAHTGIVWVPASTHCYNIGATTLSVPAGVTMRGEGMGSPGVGATCITYTGTGCAVQLESVQHSAVMDLDIQVNSASSTARALCMKSTTSVSEFNNIESVSLTAVQRRVTGQIGLWMEDTANGIYWNSVRRIRFNGWDISLQLHSSGTTQGTNSNTFVDLMSYAHNTAYQLRAGTKQVSDNRFFSLACSRSDGTLATNQNCMMMGDDNVAGVFGNLVLGLSNDSGAPSVCGVLGTNAGANLIIADCESGGGFQDNNTTGTFPNIVINQIGLGSTQALMSIGNLVTTRGATIIGTSWFGPVGNGAAGAGAIIQFHGSDANAANQPGGGWQFTSGNGGSGNSNPGDILISNGVRQGSGQGGTLVLGPSAGQGASGILIRSSRIVDDEKPFPALDCAGAGISISTSNLLDRGLFTCSTNQNAQMPTAQGSGGIVQGLPGNGVSSLLGGPLLGFPRFHFTIAAGPSSTLTLLAGTGTTFPLGAITVVAGAGATATRQVLCVVTATTVNSETISCY